MRREIAPDQVDYTVTGTRFRVEGMRRRASETNAAVNNELTQWNDKEMQKKLSLYRERVLIDRKSTRDIQRLQPNFVDQNHDSRNLIDPDQRQFNQVTTQ